jgi:localization factor PodJL
MLALAGLQLGKAYMNDTRQVATHAAKIPSSQTAATASAKPNRPAVRAAAPVKPQPAVASAMPSHPRAEPVGTETPALVPQPVKPVVQAPMAAAQTSLTATQDMMPGVDEDEKTSALPPVISSKPTLPEPAVQPQANAADPTIEVPAEIGPAALREAATKGDAKALFEIGSRYADGRGITQDMATAAKWYERAANLGFAPAQYRIGNFYEKGVGVERDIKKAKTWYQMAAEQGNASAMHNLAVLFAMAADGPPDNESAARWFQAAADLGVKDSQFNLGILAAKGVGVKQNLEEAYKWFELVAESGDKDAIAKRDEVAKALRPEQLERARAAAKLWKAKPINQMANSADIPESWQDVPTTTASIDMTKAVRNIQRILNKNGYPAGSDDGVMGDKTRNAIMAFQSDNDMDPTGQVDKKLVKALLARK